MSFRRPFMQDRLGACRRALFRSIYLGDGDGLDLRTRSCTIQSLFSIQVAIYSLLMCTNCPTADCEGKSITSGQKARYSMGWAESAVLRLNCIVFPLQSPHGGIVLMPSRGCDYLRALHLATSHAAVAVEFPGFVPRLNRSWTVSTPLARRLAGWEVLTRGLTTNA